MRAILCQLEFGYTIKKYDNDGVPFRTHLHVPEVHPDTGRLFYEREDPGHVLKACLPVVIHFAYSYWVHAHVHRSLFVSIQIKFLNIVVH